jgi:hypothetical protein
MRKAVGDDALDKFAACWEELADPRTGNSALHDFHELLEIALCAVLCGGQGAVDMALFAKVKERFLRGFLKLENGVPFTTRSAGCSVRSIRTDFGLPFRALWRSFRSNMRVLSQLMGDSHTAWPRRYLSIASNARHSLRDATPFAPWLFSPLKTCMTLRIRLMLRWAFFLCHPKCPSADVLPRRRSSPSPSPGQGRRSTN